MQKSFNSYKCLMISVNLSSRHLLHGDSAELQELQEALNSANQSWTQACDGLESWERRLHSALMQCQVRQTHTQVRSRKVGGTHLPLPLLQEFHETLRSLLLWLTQVETTLSGVNISDPATPRRVLLEHRDALTVRCFLTM